VTIALSFGKYGGFYAHFSGAAWRVCLGWMALTVLFMDLDNWLEEWLDRAEQSVTTIAPCARTSNGRSSRTGPQDRTWRGSGSGSSDSA